MNIFVCVKQVPDTEAKISIKSDSTGIDTNAISKWVVNPYDEFAIEESLKLKEKLNDGSTVTAVSMGPKAGVSERLRTALAMGCDNAIVVDAPENLDSNQVAKGLAEVLKKEGFNGPVFTGKQAIDDDCAQVSQLLAEYLGVPHTTVAIGFELSADKNSATVTREGEGGGKEVLQLQLPCVIGANKGLNSPRYASLPGIMKAKKKEIKEYTFASLGVAATESKITYKNFTPPPARQAGKMIAGDAKAQAAELVKLLRQEAKVI